MKKLLSVLLAFIMVLGLVSILGTEGKAASPTLKEIRITVSNNVTKDEWGFYDLPITSAVATTSDGKTYNLSKEGYFSSYFEYYEEKGNDSFYIGAYPYEEDGDNKWGISLESYAYKYISANDDYIYTNYLNNNTKCYVNDKLASFSNIDENDCAYFTFDGPSKTGKTTSIAPGPVVDQAPNASTFKEEAANTVYRLLNRSNNAHLYTTDVTEAKTLISQGWVQEISSGISSTSGTGVYRLYNKASGEHLYTSDTHEVDVLAGSGWQKDFDGKPLFYGSSNGSKAVYRLYNAAAPQVASHHYTSDTNEIKTLLSQGWKYDNEGKPVYTLQ